MAGYLNALRDLIEQSAGTGHGTVGEKDFTWKRADRPRVWAPRGPRGPRVRRLSSEQVGRWHCELLMRRQERGADPRDLDVLLGRLLP